MNDWNMSRQNEVTEAPNYLNANIAMFGVNLTWVLFVIWATLGFLFVLVASALISVGLSLLKTRMSQEHAPRHPHRRE